MRKVLIALLFVVAACTSPAQGVDPTVRPAAATVPLAPTDHATTRTSAPTQRATQRPTERPKVDPANGATAKCADGTYSFSAHHSGTCSHHGGVAVWYK